MYIKSVSTKNIGGITITKVFENKKNQSDCGVLVLLNVFARTNNSFDIERETVRFEMALLGFRLQFESKSKRFKQL